MTLDELIDVADMAYETATRGVDEHFVKAYHESDDAEVGDTLAQFIARELHDTFNPDADDESQLRDACHAMQTAVSQLGEVADYFETELTTEESHLTRGETK